MSPSDGRLTLLRGLSEEAWSRQVQAWALRGGYCGVHIRHSLTQGRGYAVLRGVHTLANSDHDDGRGIPDWLFARAGSTLLVPELKAVIGRASPDQLRWLDLLNQVTGVKAPIWRPTDEDQVRAELLGEVA